jgi:hypothetical protein
MHTHEADNEKAQYVHIWHHAWHLNATLNLPFRASHAGNAVILALTSGGWISFNHDIYFLPCCEEKPAPCKAKKNNGGHVCSWLLGHDDILG